MVEIDGSFHYYSVKEPLMNQMTDFKYRLFNLYKLPYLRIEYWQHAPAYRTQNQSGKGHESMQKGLQLNKDSVMEMIKQRVTDIEQ